jgi:hypothetical protein
MCGLYIKRRLECVAAVALNFENLVAKVLPITISSAAMVKEKGRLIGIGTFELDERFSTLDNLAALCALLYFRHCFLTYRGLEQAFAMLMVTRWPLETVGYWSYGRNL